MKYELPWAAKRSCLMDDAEIGAMKKIADALEPLDEAARGRALQWAMSRYRTSKNIEVISPLSGGAATTDLVVAGPPYQTFAELFDASGPTSESEKALVAAYWIQVCQGMASFPSQVLNDELKDLGHGIGNITEALSQLKKDRPALILQLKKSGTTKQARKTYKLTQEGMKRVQSMVRGEI